VRDWIHRARKSRIAMLVQFAQTMKKTPQGHSRLLRLPNFNWPFGTNTKIQAMKRQAYGFRDHEFFKLKILAIHQAKYALVG
jgi:transposase